MVDTKHSGSDLVRTGLENNFKRRKALQSLITTAAVAGSAASLSTWTKPMVRSVVLPTHANTSNTNTASLRDPCVLQIICTETGIQVNGSGQVEGGGDLSGININLAITYDGDTQNRAGITSASGEWSVSPVVFEPSGISGTVMGVVSSTDRLFTPNNCEINFDCSNGGDDGEDPCTEGCEPNELVYFRVKTTSSLEWGDGGVGNNDCVGFLEGSSKAVGSTFFDDPDGNVRGYSITLKESIPGYSSCEVVHAWHKAGSEQSTNGNSCVEGEISNDGQKATFTPNNVNDKDISHAEIIIACCPIKCP